MRSLFGSIAAATTPARRLTNESPVPLSSRRSSTQFMLPSVTTDGVEQQLKTMSTQGTVFGVVDKIATAVAGVEWNLWRKAASGVDEDREQVTSHAALTLWEKPNPFMPRQEFVETISQHLELVGETDWLMGRVAGVKFPIELWPVRPDRIEPVPHPRKFLSGYVYTSPDGEKIPLELSDVIQVKRPNPWDPYRGLGPVQALMNELDAARYGAEWNASFFRNSAMPGGIIEVDRRLGDDEFDELRDRWDDQHRGVSKAHRVAILEQGKWVDRKFSMKDLLFTDLRTMNRDTILEAWGFPKAMLGITEDVNRANAEAGEYVFAKWLTVTRLERLKAALNNDLLPLYGDTARGLEFDYVSPVPENSEADNANITAKANAVVTLAAVGFDAPALAEAWGLPAVAYSKPEPVVPAALPSRGGTGEDDQSDYDLANRLPLPDNAMRWEAVECDDDSTCEPCKANRGHLYRNRADAYADYPDGKGYVKCVGAQYGNSCRGTVRKRRVKE